MRVTDSMIAENARLGVASARERNLEAQRAASTGVRVDQPSDDPVAAGLARRRKGDELRATQMQRAADFGATRLQSTDATYEAIGGVLDRIRELAIQGSNATLSASDRSALAVEVGGLRDQAIALANTQLDGRFLLAGMVDDVAPFNGITGAFVGDRNVQQLEVAPGVRSDVSVPGGDVLSPVAGVDVFATLETLRLALAANNPVATQATIADLVTSIEQVSQGRAQSGVAMEGVEMARSVSKRIQDAARVDYATLMEVDTFDALSELNRADTLLQQAVSIAARLPLPGLAQQGR